VLSGRSHDEKDSAGAAKPRESDRLLSNRFVPLALALVAPVIVNILAFHAFLAPAGLALPLVLLATELVLAYSYRAAFAPMLGARVNPEAPESTRDYRPAAANA
jgi:hypothetical protein